MGEILRSSISFVLASNGFSCQCHLCNLRLCENRICLQHRHVCPCLYLGSTLETRRKPFRKHDSSVIRISQSGFTYFGFGKFSQTNFLYKSVRMGNSIIAPNMEANLESGLVCEEDGGSTTVLRGIEGFRENSHELKQPTWRNLQIHEDSAFEHRDIRLGLTVLKEMIQENKIGVHYIDEKDEEVLSKRILNLSRRNKVRSALELHMSMILSGLRPNIHACNSLLSCLLRNDMVDDALRIFKFMKANEITSCHTYSLILKAIANNQGLDAALEMFAKLGSECKVAKDFDAIVYNTMISVCGKVDNWLQTERIWRSMKEHGKAGTKVTYCLLVCIFVRCGQNDLAIDAYREMVRNGLEPVEDVMQAMIGACAKEGKWDLALGVFHSMLNCGLKPNPTACNALIHSLGKGGQVKLAFRVHELMNSLGHISDSYTWNALLHALYKANRHADTLQLLKCIEREQSSQLNLQLYNTALMSCQRLGLWDKALQLLWQMEASKISVSTASYNLVIGACEVARKPKIALQVYEHMIHQKCTPDTFTFLSLIRSCIWGSLWTEVEDILYYVGPNSSLYNAAIHGMCLRSKNEMAKKLYMRMLKTGLKPDGKTRALMLQNLSKGSHKQKRRCFLS